MASTDISPWSQNMSQIHSPISTEQHDEESINSSSQFDMNSKSTKLIPLQDESNYTPRKRNNSLIPIELMKNTSEGGRECAALATVFGVPEYVDSKVFWDRQQQQPTTMTMVRKSNGEKYGYIAVNDVSVVANSITPKRNNNGDDINAMLQTYENTSKYAISSYVDSILGPVGSSEFLKPAFLTKNDKVVVVPQPSKSFSLPRIPTVSEFNDFLVEESSELIVPASPSSILLHSSIPTFRNVTLSSSGSSSITNNTFTPLEANVEEAIQNNEDNESIKSRVVVIVGPPEIFDLLISDNDERFVIWGPDPIALSSSMATTSAEEGDKRLDSYATLYNKNQEKRPELKGFSSNATATLIRSKSIQNVSSNTTNNNKRPTFRLNTQFWSESLRIGRPVKDSDGNNAGRSLLLKKSFSKPKTNKKVNQDQAIVEQKRALAEIPKVIEAATIHKLVEKLTNTLDYTFMTDFFLTYRDFLNSEDLCKMLISRFYWALENDEESRRIVRIRTFVVLRHWLNNYFVHDFIGNRPLRVIFTDFLNKLPRHPLVQKSPRDQRIVKMLKRVVRRLKKLYYNRSSGASRVKVIPPPPPTAEQEHMSELVRAKLSQNAIRRKTALGMDMSSHHNGNMAVQDARYAPVVVVGSLHTKGSFIDPGVPDKNLSLRRQPSNHSSHPQPNSAAGQHPETGHAIAQGSRRSSSVHQNHRYDKNVHDTSTAVTLEASSVISVASDDSLESDLSAGDTVPNMSDDESIHELEYDNRNSNNPVAEDSALEHDGPERHWIQEQQETLNYFKSLTEVNEDNHQNTTIDNEAESSAEPIPQNSEKKLIEKTGSISENVSTAQVAPTQDGDNSPRAVRRVPSERWCKDADDDIKKARRSFDSKSLPDELRKELSGEESLNGTKYPVGLSRKLSEKSIEKRKSEKSLQDAMLGTSSSVASSASNSPYLTSQPNNADIPELPPLTADMLEHLNSKTSKSPIKKKKTLLARKKSANTIEATPTKDEADTFVSIPYELTTKKLENEVEKLAIVTQPLEEKLDSKRKLTRVLSKVFNRPGNEKQKEEPQALGKTSNTLISSTAPTDLISPTSTTLTDVAAPDTTETPTVIQEPKGAGEFVSLIAQKLRNNSIDGATDYNGSSDEEDEKEKQVRSCSNCSDTTKNCDGQCKRLSNSALFIGDAERRHSFELRRKRGASIDMLEQKNITKQVLNMIRSSTHPVTTKTANKTKTKSNSTNQIKSGPIYLGHLQARSVIGADSSITDQSKINAEDDSDSDLDSENESALVPPSERSIRTEAQAASSTREKMSFISDITNMTKKSYRRSKLVELGAPSTSLVKNNHEQQQRQKALLMQGSPSVPRSISISLRPTNSSGRSFIMSYKTRKLADQLCFIERDVLIKVGWEELIHCKWTKMNSSGEINTNYAADNDKEGDLDDEDENFNYTRRTEMRRKEEQGIEQVIQRFNVVCQWVASEIVRTRNINDRVKLIEKFIRLAKKCKMYSNYATLVQILLGLQSPAVARLEKTWAKVSSKYQKHLSKLTEFTSPMKNWKNIRDSMTEVAEEYGNSPSEVQVEMPGTTVNRNKFKKTTRIKIPFGGCIPFLGIYLSDLVFNSEKPRYLKPNLDNQKIYNTYSTKNLPECLDQPLVNFRKHRVIATVIKRVLTFQGLATRYSFDEEPHLMERCRNLDVLDAVKIRELSASIE